MIDEYLHRIQFERELYIEDFTNKFRHNSWGPPYTPQQRDQQAMWVIARSPYNSEDYDLTIVQNKWLARKQQLSSVTPKEGDQE